MTFSLIPDGMQMNMFECAMSFTSSVFHFESAD